jgi:hypothetical protein
VLNGTLSPRGTTRSPSVYFTATSCNTADAAQYFGVPGDRTVIMGTHIEV